MCRELVIDLEEEPRIFVSCEAESIGIELER